MKNLMLAILCLLALSISAEETLHLSDAEVIEKVKLSRASKSASSIGLEATTSENVLAAFHQPAVEWDTAKIKHLEFTLKTNAKGAYSFACNTNTNGTIAGFRVPIADVVADGEYHIYNLILEDNPKWTGIMTNWEIRWTGEPATIGLKSIKGYSEVNEALKYQLQLAKEKRRLKGAALVREVLLKKATKLPSTEALEAITADGVPAIFYQSKLAWDATDIKQIEFTLKTNAPGYYSFACCTEKDGQRSTIKITPHAAIPDGEYHTYLFNVSEDPACKGIITNWELKWIGEPATVGMKSLHANNILNCIGDAAALQPGRESIVNRLLPRSKCRLAWEGATSPGAVVRFYDYELKEIPDSKVTLEAGQKEVLFIAPEMLIEARVEVLDAGQGFPVLQQLEYIIPGAASNLTWRGKWIWSQNAPGPIDRSLWFERILDLDEAPEFAAIAAVGDDSCLVYVNGKFVGRTSRWTVVGRHDITQYLKVGKNRISCRVKNIDSWGGFLADVYVKLDNKEIFADTDERWLLEKESNTDTHIPVANEPVVVLGKSTIPPWYGGMAYRYAGPRGMLKLVESKPGKLTVKVEKLPPDASNSLRFAVQDLNGNTSEFTLRITPSMDQWKLGETITINYPIPHVEKGIFKISLNDDMVNLQGNPVLMTLDRSKVTPPPLRRATFTGGGRPMLKMDDEMINPVFWHAPNCYKGKDLLDGIKNMAENNFRSFRVAAKFDDFWKEDGSFDFTDFDMQVANLLTVEKDAVFAVHVYSWMPEWWLAKNPDDLSRHEHGNPRDLWLDKQALGSRKWLTDAEIPFKALIDHIKASSYADRVWGMSFTENNCGEWFWTSADATGKRSYAGYSPADYRAFRERLRAKYKTDKALAQAWNMPGVTIDNAPMPSAECARKGSVGALLQMPQDQQIIDYFEFRSMALAEAIMHFGKFIKEQTDGKWMTGAYYGYFAEMIANPRRNIQSNGHNGFIETAMSPYVDFVHAPLRYTVRKTGQPGAMMQVWDTYLLRGKMVYVEQDVRTSYAPIVGSANGKIYCGTPSTAFCDIGQFIRSFGMATATGALNYWYDLAYKQFDEKALNKAITELNKIYLSLAPVKGTTPCEVAIVSDRDSAYYSQYPAADTPSTIASECVFKHFNELAVPFKSLTITDLLDESLNLQAFKCYVVLPALMLTKVQRAQLLARFEKEKATVVWLYAAGAFYPDHGPSDVNCADFLGIKTKMSLEKTRAEMVTNDDFGSITCINNNEIAPLFLPVSGFDTVIGKNESGQPMMVAKKLADSTHYFTALANIPMPLYAKILEKAGVHIYSDIVNTDQYWIGNDVLFIHASTNGDKSFVLPTGRKARGIAGPFKETLKSGDTFKARAGMTYGFLIE
jgi:hypothetical protein